MPGLSDWEYQSPGGSSQFGKRRLPPTKFLIIGALIAAGAAYLWFARSPAAPPGDSADDATTAEQPAAQPVAEKPPYDLPPLEDSDEFMRERIRALSSHSVVAMWLRTNGLVRNLVVVLDNTARGLTPSRHLAALRPAGTFRVVRQGARTVIDPRNYDRFTAIAEAAASIDAAAAGKLYVNLKPLLQTAYDELGNQEPIDRALGRAIGGLLQAPIVEGDIEVERGTEGIGYVYSDVALEVLTGAQKQLVRMGPANTKTIKAQLRQFAAAAGIPAG